MTAVDEARERGRELAAALAADGVAGVTIAWADNNGIPRSRTVPVASLPEVAVAGVGVTTLFAVFDTNDAITFAAPGLQTPSGDVRLVPQLDRVTRLAGQPAFAWAPGRQVTADGGPWAFDQRSVLERTVARLAEDGYSALVGYEMEFGVFEPPQDDDEDALVPAHPGPAYSPHALLPIHDFVASVMRDAEANGLRLGQIHAEYGPAQVELSIAATDPLTAADQQLLARQTVLAAAEAHGLRVSFAPLPTLAGAGNGWHIHTSLWRDGENLLAGGPEGPRGTAGAAYIAGLLRDLPALAAVTAPSVGSLARLRPGFFAGAFGFWGVENREAPLRFVPGSALLGEDHANVELKVSDASANPYLALAALLSAGAAGVEENLAPPAPVGEDPGTWKKKERAAAGIAKLPTTQAEQEEALAANPRIAGVLGEELLGAFLAVRRADAAWAQEKETEEVLAAWRWKY
ncbi:glutamine synthetase family protein [Actinomycetospora endophytica]|uniref:Glutamine synthetase family protein n=1 Tax=Actinomycetospora endophytica TaxID=2291215 RepID=A0ABS8PF33_9PSEU|nr:glutamine synthetase family protein [Actinomycetospora endophytica]MCD2196861.1 glutamine synthetase family protein [Actinomycetospora endophytica]